MLRYAKVVNEETKEVNVGLGTDKAFFAKLGMSEVEVEQADSGRWYLKGYAPVCAEVKIRKLQRYLNSTDWYISRFAETGVEIPAEVKEKRAAARVEIDALRELESGEQEGANAA